MSEKRFPIIGEDWDISWSMAEEAYRNYEHDFPGMQSLERLAERGGFSLKELEMYLPCWEQKRELDHQGTEFDGYLNDLWAIIYSDDPTGWVYPAMVVRHIQEYFKEKELLIAELIVKLEWKEDSLADTIKALTAIVEIFDRKFVPGSGDLYHIEDIARAALRKVEDG